jgi:hypothetical protein
VLLGECILDKLDAKFLPLKSRANELHQSVDQAEILSVVFTSSDSAQSDYEKAANAALYGGGDICQLLELVENDAGVGGNYRETKKQ